MKGKSEVKFLIAFLACVAVGFLMGSVVLGIVAGTCLGLVWGYTEHLLKPTSSHHHHVKSPVKKAKRKKASRKKSRK